MIAFVVDAFFLVEVEFRVLVVVQDVRVDEIPAASRVSQNLFVYTKCLGRWFVGLERDASRVR